MLIITKMSLLIITKKRNFGMLVMVAETGKCNLTKDSYVLATLARLLVVAKATSTNKYKTISISTYSPTSPMDQRATLTCYFSLRQSGIDG